MLSEELAQFRYAQIEQTGQKQKVLEGELRAVEAELETFSADRQRFDALRDVCNALDKLGELKAGELSGKNVQNAPGHLERARNRIAGFEGAISGILEKQASLQGQINRCLDELNILDEEVREAYAREERRQEEYVIEREISPIPYRVLVMPWPKEAESERRFRRSLLVALLYCVFFSAVIRSVKFCRRPVRPAVAVVPERLVSMLRKEPPKPEPLQRPKEEKKPEKIRKKQPRKIDPNQPPQKHRPRVKKRRARAFWLSRIALKI